MSTPTWLPAALKRTDFADESALEIAVWTLFQTDFKTPPVFRNEKIFVDRNPHKACPNREHSYWHLITEGEPEENRTTPVPDRLEHLPWAKPIIENEACPLSAIKVWSNRRGGSTHVCIWFDRMNYLVILKQLPRDNYFLKTAYRPGSQGRQRLHKEYASWKKNGARL